MAQTVTHRSWCAFFPEVQVGQPPADWATNGIAIEHVSVDVSTVKQAMLQDPTLEGRSFAVGTRPYIPGIRNNQLTVGIKVHGVGEVTAVGDVVDDTYLAKLLRHCMGGTHLGTSATVTGGTATAPTVDDATGIIVGSFVAFQDTTSPLPANAGKVHFRRVIEVDENTLTLSEALPFTPANNDLAHAAVTAYLNENVLEDAVEGPGGPHTLSWFVKKQRAGTALLWQCEGSVASMQLQNLNRGQLPTIQLSVQAANFRHGGVDGLTNPSFTTIEGHPQLSMGKDVLCSIEVYKNTAIGLRHVNQVGFDAGFTRTAVQTATEVLDRFEGLASYAFGVGDTRLTLTVLPYSDNWYAGQIAGQEYRITLYQPGDGSGAGKGWCLHLPRAQLVETPGRADVETVHAATLVFQAMEADDCVGGSNEDLEKSRFLFGLA